ncbi:hypothetical protein X271_00544 [Candidatus Hepatoplasma crinochetorum Av]|uniref:Uncharacterized protein n=1 Tax=Candidatus Hepatoplasma crinochetorum Av TaxID=1427984 RepID=W8GFT4_9MOLU|nr:hypothetical protein [Candidatus Hepatoplasma crinochetorum]AHK22644.1 hypothetical protein X271_00544 [Candidatus Hepatoplasma crinochetorum Av]
MTFLTQENLIVINEEIRYKYDLEIPPVFLYGNSDIKAFINLGELLSNEFDFDNKELKKLNAKKYFKISIEELINSPENKSEPKDWGFGYSKESKNGKASGSERSKKIKQFFLEKLNAKENLEDNSLIKLEKIINPEKLSGIGEDLITDFVLITKEKEIKEFTKIIFNKIEKEKGLKENLIIKSLQENYKINNNTNIDAFPFLIPINIVDEFIGSLGKEFEKSIFKKFINKNDIHFDYKEDEKEAFKTNFRSSFSEKRNEWLNFKKIKASEEFLKLKNEIKQINFDKNFNFLLEKKNWEINLFLSNREVLRKNNLNRNVLILKKENGEIIIKKYFIRNEEIFLFNSNLNIENLAIKEFKREIFKSSKYSNFPINIVITRQKFNEKNELKNVSIMYLNTRQIIRKNNIKNEDSYIKKTIKNKDNYRKKFSKSIINGS